MLSEAELQRALRNVDRLSLDEKRHVLDLLDEREHVLRIARARTGFIDFVKAVWPEFIPGAHHNIVGEAFERVVHGDLRRLIISMPPRFCLAVDTPIPTPRGWATMRALRPGDEVFGPDGLPTCVLGKSNVHTDHRCFKVTTGDGAEVVCDGGHLWRVALDRKRPEAFTLWTTEDLFERQQYAIESVQLPDTLAPVRILDRYISIEQHPTVPVQCIEVARSDGLFLAGKGFVATHNTKSELSSVMLPAWFFGQNPRRKVIQVSNNADLAAGFGRRVRNLLSGEGTADGQDPYHEIFPDVGLAKDSQAAFKWHTSLGGEYFAVGVNGIVTGKGADLAILDDLHALELSTPIPTPRGFVAIGELQIGDDVFGPDGAPTKVTAKSVVAHNRDLYRVETNDGAEVLCDAAHLWSYRSDTKVTAPFRVATAAVLSEWAKASKPVIPRHAAVQYPRADLPIEPYCLGYWLGNGTATLGRITCNVNDLAYIRAQFESAGYQTTDQADPHNFGVPGLRAQIIGAGLFDNKHVPEGYLTASVEQRLALLQGLMDSDGDVTKAGQCSFNNTNLRLLEAVRSLVHSLGARCSPIRLIPRSTHGYASTTEAYRTCFKMKDAARIPRKRERTFSPTDKRGRSITVQPTGATGSVQCITVDRPDGLFLAGRGYVVTHNSEQEAKQAESDPSVFDDVYAWYTSGIRQRLQPGGSIIIPMTRWSKRDIVGQVLRRMAADQQAGLPTDEWEVIELPAILDEGTPTERSMWPGFWPIDELRKTRSALPVPKWKAQYQQQPTSEQGAILKREYWRRWGVDTPVDIAAGRTSCPGDRHMAAWHANRPPACEFVLQSWDCAATKHERANYSACTTWGVFKVEDRTTGRALNHIILLSAWRSRMELPELKARARQFYMEDSPDTLLIENKSAGTGLIQEFRSMGMPVESFNESSRGTRAMPNDKVARANLVVDIFASGYVWAPDLRSADEVIEECGEFPNGEFDDYVDSTVQAMIRFRAGGLVRTAHDEAEEPEVVAGFRRRRYY